jgi:penicillin-binding protein 1A
VALCRVSSQLATPECQANGSAYEDELPYELVPQGFCQSPHQSNIAQPATFARPVRRSSGPGLFDRIRGWFQ